MSIKQTYEAPTVTDFGSVEELTQGQLEIHAQDFPVGSRTVGSLPVVGPLPSLPTLPQ